MNSNICCIFNLAPHYRAPIYRLMDEKLHCDFYITIWKINPFKQMKYVELTGFKKTLTKVSLFQNLYWQNGILKLAFKQYKYYIFTAEPYSLSIWLLLVILKLLRKKTYLWTHGWYGDESMIKSKIKKFYFAFFNKILLYGNYARDLMIKEGFDHSKLVCIYNSLDYNQQIKIRKELKQSDIYRNYFANNFPVLLYIGRIQKVKKIELLIEAIKLLEIQGIKCNLVIIGEEFDKTNLNELIIDKNLNKRVWKYGPCYDEKEIGELIFNSAICVSPGNIGLTAIHSLTYGIPIITHNNFKNQMPEFETISPGLNGDFFKEDSLSDLVSKIKKWLIMSRDNKENIRQQCYKVVDEKYNPNYQLEILLDTIK